MPRQKIATADLISGFALSALGLYIVWQSSAWKIFGSEGPGPGFFPLFYGGLMFAVAAWIALRSLRGAPAAEATEKKDPKGTWIALLTWAGLALSIPLMIVVGFIPGFAVFTFLLIRMAFGQSYLRSLIAGIAIPTVLYIVFAVLLSSDLPESMFWGF
jgi:putative tricarboxylic transport membrane protein